MSKLADHCPYVLAQEHPACGCNRPEAPLSLEGRWVSSIAIQKIVPEHGLGTRYDRELVLEKASADKAPEPTAEQVAFLETLNPCLREDHVESTASGGLPSADSFFVSTLEGGGQGLSARGRGYLPLLRLRLPARPQATRNPRWRCCTTTVLALYRRLDLPVRRS